MYSARIPKTKINKVLLISVIVMGVIILGTGGYFGVRWFLIKQAHAKIFTGVLKVKLPKSISRQDLQNPTEEIEQQLTALTNEALRNKPEVNRIMELDQDSRPAISVVLTEGNKPILPNTEQAASDGKPTSTPIPVEEDEDDEEEEGEEDEDQGNGDHGDEDGPEPPPPPPLPTLNFEWDEDELEYDHCNDAKSKFEEFYPAIEDVYGRPCQPQTIKVHCIRQGQQNIPSYYNVSTKEIFLNAPEDPGEHYDPEYAPVVALYQIVHLILASLHDEFVPFLPEVWERGFTDVVTPIIFGNIHGHYPFTWQSYRGIYEKVNTPLFAFQDGNGIGNYNMDIHVYNPLDVLGVAWQKVYLEDGDFFKNFNAELCEQTPDASLKTKLVDLAKGVLPQVEGQDFAAWYNDQYVLNIDNMPYGEFYHADVLDNINQYPPIYVAFENKRDGSKINVGSGTYQAQFFDNNGNLLGTPAMRRNVRGVAGLSDNFPTPPMGNYTGLAEIIVSSLQGQSISALTTHVYYQNGLPPTFATAKGVYGAIPGATQGQVSVTHLASGAKLFSQIDKGAFLFPEFYGSVGQFKIEYDDYQNDIHASRLVNKVIGNCFVYLRVDMPPPVLSPPGDTTPEIPPSDTTPEEESEERPSSRGGEEEEEEEQPPGEGQADFMILYGPDNFFSVKYPRTWDIEGELPVINFTSPNYDSEAWGDVIPEGGMWTIPETEREPTPGDEQIMFAVSTAKDEDIARVRQEAAEGVDVALYGGDFTLTQLNVPGADIAVKGVYGINNVSMMRNAMELEAIKDHTRIYISCSMHLESTKRVCEGIMDSLSFE